MPDGTTLLIDGGGRPDFSRGSNAETDRDEELFGHETRSIGEAVVSEYLWWRGLDHIDYLLATHADADHINGLCDVARNFQVRSALVARVPDSDAEFLRFAQTLRARGIPLTLIGRGDVLQFGKVKATVLWPLKSDDSAAPSQNNDSVVLRFDYGDRSILFTGDIESGAERALLEAKDNLHADVVKVAHHGSRTSSIEPFVRATGCGLAIISVGQTSIFGHPNPDVVQRWQAAGADVLTTGNSGTITITTDGSSLEKRTFAGSQ
jgi:competence protein ComEC